MPAVGHEAGGFKHEPVMVEEVLQYLRLEKGAVIVDATVGSGGHAEAIANEISPGGLLIAIDRDPEAINAARERLSIAPVEVRYHREDYRNLRTLLDHEGIERVDGILFDLGVSSLQIEKGSRGFSFRLDAPLDMRMDPDSDLTASRIVNTYTEKEIARILRVYGEEMWSERIARFIVEARKRAPIETTGDLVKVIKDAVPAGARRGGIHPARRTFQALRIAVNDELGSLKVALEQAVSSLKKTGRIVVLSYHSLEDRIVKRTLSSLAKGPDNPPGFQRGQRCLEILTKKPVRPGSAEVERNPRSRSAKLRAAERLC